MTPNAITIPDFALVVLIGSTGSGKSSFAAKHFLETEIVSSDHCRALVSDDETDLAATGDAFDLLNYTAAIRLKRRLLTVIDATSVKREDRAKLVRLARKYHAVMNATNSAQNVILGNMFPATTPRPCAGGCGACKRRAFATFTS